MAGSNTDTILASLQMEKGNMIPAHLKAEFIKKKNRTRFMFSRKFRRKKKASKRLPKPPGPRGQGKLF